MNISGTTASDLTNTMVDFSVQAETTEGAGAGKEITWQNNEWSKDYGYYLRIPEFKKAVDTKALWTMGAGFTADDVTTLLLRIITGNGKETFNMILKNMIKVKTMSRDSFAEIVRSKKDNNVLVNLKPLDPSTIRITQNAKGIITQYDQMSKIDGENKSIHKFAPEQIFHLSHERVADEIKGTRILDSLMWLIDARNESMQDWRTMLHRNVNPVNIHYLDTDDPVKIAAYKKKVDAAQAKGENIYVPKGAVEVVTGGISPNSTMNPLPWIALLNDYFFQSVNVPQIIIGNGSEFTDASGKIVYLSYEQCVKDEQKYIEEQVLLQLNIEIQLTFPASLQNDAISDIEKAPDLQASQPNDTTAELEGKT